ncbi:hypothetical protein Trydic_g9370 [Trypoxylus dichotomus]
MLLDREFDDIVSANKKYLGLGVFKRPVGHLLNDKLKESRTARTCPVITTETDSLLGFINEMTEFILRVQKKQQSLLVEFEEATAQLA